MTPAKDGVTAREAAEQIYQEPEPPKPTKSPSKSPVELLPSGNTYVEESGYSPSLRVCAVLDELVEETWYATGISSPLSMNSRRQRVPAELWGSLNLDLSANSATDPNGDLVISDLLFYEVQKPTARAETTCRQLLVERMKAPRNIYKENLFDKYFEDFGDSLSRKAFGRAYKEAQEASTTHKTWRRRGPIA